jgi:phospholipid/cholesterol/gamma-HCH transport system substrate-binding protein
MNRMTLAVIGIVLISMLVYFSFSKRIPFLHGYRMSANFASSNQLVVGFSPVRIAGVTVGKVTGVKKGPGDTSQVQMELKDSALPLHSDARVRIRPRLFLEGGFYVELAPGSPSAPVLKDGSVLPRNQTADPVQLHQILATFDQNTLRDLRTMVKELDTGLDHGGAEGLGRAVVAFGPVLRDTAQLTEAARGDHVHDVSEGIGATAKITHTLAQRQDELRGLVTSLNRTTTALASRDAQVAESIVQIDGLIREAPAALDSLDRVQPVFREFIDELRPSLRISPPILDDVAGTLRQLRGITSSAELPALLVSVDPTIRALPRLNNRLQPLFKLITPVMDCLREHAAPVLNAEVPDGALSSGHAVWQDLAQAGVGVVGFAQNFDGNGYTSRYLNGAGEQSFATGDVPGLGQLVATTAEPVAGSRPTYLGPGQLPPYRPDAACADQAQVDLSQRADGGAPAAAAAGTRTVTATERRTAANLFSSLKAATR